MSKKRYRNPKIKDGELKLWWGKLPHDSPDLCVGWEGYEGGRHDIRMVLSFFTWDHPEIPIMKQSFIKELEDRGYDITTIKFSIMKKKPENV